MEIQAQAERDSGVGLKLFGFIAESMFTFIRESCLRSSRNSVRNHPGIAFTFPRIPHHHGVGSEEWSADGFTRLPKAHHAGRSSHGRTAGYLRRVRKGDLRERTRAGLAHARENGKRLGRPMTAGLQSAAIRKLHRAGVSKTEIARRVQIGRTSVRRILAAKS
jgi:Helix-turn-helix domain of resolvase